MMAYEKYINSAGTHYISNSGSDENGGLKGGAAGDQNGKEWQLRAWYSRPWTHVLRHPDAAVAQKIAELGCAAALNNNIGYDQNQRTTYWKQLSAVGYDPSAITVKCEEDCTAGVAANVKAVGYLLGIKALQDVRTDTTSRNMRARFSAAGFQVLTESKHLTGTAHLLPGDILLYENHHAATNVTKGKSASWAVNPTLHLGDRVLKNGMSGNDVKELQTVLLELGYDLGKWGADGDFGDATEIAVKAFQSASGLAVDGHVGVLTVSTLDEAANREDAPADTLRTVEIVGGDCYVRSAPNTNAAKLGTAKRGTTYAYGGQTSDDGWNLIDYKNQNGWVSGKYSRLAEVKSYE